MDDERHFADGPRNHYSGREATFPISCGFRGRAPDRSSRPRRLVAVSTYLPACDAGVKIIHWKCRNDDTGLSGYRLDTACNAVNFICTRTARACRGSIS